MMRLKFIRAVQNKKFELALSVAMTHKNEFSALIIAVDNNCVQLCETLLRMGWDVNEVRLKDGVTPIHAAVIRKNYTLVDMLIEHGAMVARRDISGNIPMAKLLQARYDFNARRVYGLLAGAMRADDFKRRNIHGETLLHVLAKNNTNTDCNMYWDIMGKGVEIAAKDLYTGRNFLMDLVLHHSDVGFMSQIMSVVNRRGLSLNERDMFGANVIHRIVEEQKCRLLDVILDYEDVSVRSVNIHFQSPMTIAAKRVNVCMMRLLYEAGATIDWRVLNVVKASGSMAVEQRRVLLMVEEEVQGRIEINGTTRVKTLKLVAKERVRSQMIKVHEGNNIRHRIERLPLPQELKQYVREWSVESPVG